MAGFYGVYLAKQLSQRSQGIRTNQMGRGNKELRTLTVERLLAAFSVLIVVVEVWSVVRGYSGAPTVPHLKHGGSEEHHSESSQSQPDTTAPPREE